ncbi:MAG: hypothetical protein K2P58_14895 [Hyphomonadaceae bacterium]|nr:hypothetical protein [Hyphomonadaceae bacterium]
MHDIDGSLSRMRDAWMAGQSARACCPEAWRALADSEAALAALAGVAHETLYRAAPAKPLEPRPLLPPLAAPTLPEETRARFRRIRATQKSSAPIEQELLHLIAARGFCVHPGDWMPGPRDDWAPDLYSPWLDWVRAEATAPHEEELTADTYETWSWGERRLALVRMRESNPSAALAIIEAKAATEPAERRLRLIEILAHKLSETDASFIETLLKDRSDRVAGLARAFLARLGKGDNAEAPEAELADMVELGKTGLINRRTHIAFKPLKTGPQNARRLELLNLVSLAGLARALKASEMQLVEAPPAGEWGAIQAFVNQVALSGSDEVVRTLAGHVVESADLLRCAPVLAQRLSLEERRTLLERILAHDAGGLSVTLAFMGRDLGVAALDAVLASPAFAQVTHCLDTALSKTDNAQPAHGNALLATHLNHLGLILDARGARDLVAKLAERGLSPADPKLDVLYLNAALTTEPQS